MFANLNRSGSASRSAMTMREDTSSKVNIMATANKYEAMLNKYKAAKKENIDKQNAAQVSQSIHPDAISILCLESGVSKQVSGSKPQHNQRGPSRADQHFNDLLEPARKADRENKRRLLSSRFHEQDFRGHEGST
jgi:hypothetical protein